MALVEEARRITFISLPNELGFLIFVNDFEISK